MRRLLDVIAVLLVVGFFLLGLYGAPRGEGSLYLWIAIAVVAALGVGWALTKSGEIVRGLARDFRAARVAAAKVKLRSRIPQGAEPDIDAAFSALAKKDWKGGAALMFLAAEAGEAKAQHTLSHLFAAGVGVPKSREEALKWLRRAAERMLADAQCELGVAYFTGYGGATPRDVAEGLDWLRRAADQSHDGAAVKLGEVFQRGDGVERDDEEAAGWFRRAAERGDPHGQRALGRCYAKGRGVARDGVQAFAWLSIAAKRAAARGLADFIRESEIYGTEKDLSPARRREAQWLIDAWDERIDHVDTQKKKAKRDKDRIKALGRPIADRIRGEFDRIREEARTAEPEPAEEPIEETVETEAPREERRPRRRARAEASATDRAQADAQTARKDGRQTARKDKPTARDDAPEETEAGMEAPPKRRARPEPEPEPAEAAAAPRRPQTPREAALERNRIKEEMRARRTAEPAVDAETAGGRAGRRGPDPQALAAKLRQAQARSGQRRGRGPAPEPAEADEAPAPRPRGSGIDQTG